MTLLRSNFPMLPSLVDFFDDDRLKNRFYYGEWMPAINIVENKNNFEIEVAAPGMTREDFTVTVDNRLLTIKGESKVEEEMEKKNYTRKEFSFKSFTRTFTLPEYVKEDDVVAKYQDGILRLVLKITEKAIPPKKMIAIK